MTDGDLHSQTTIRALRAVGELLAADGERASIVIIGGAALQLLQVVDRTTRDVDIVAQTIRPGELTSLKKPAEPLPAALTWFFSNWKLRHTNQHPIAGIFAIWPHWRQRTRNSMPPCSGRASRT